MTDDKFIDAFAMMQWAVHKNAKEHGWWDTPRNDGESIALMHSELSEALEALRAGDLDADHKVKAHVEEELADVIIRIMDWAEGRGLDVARAIVDKHEVNKARPHKHGGKRF